MFYQLTIPSPLGPVTLASDGKALAGLWFEGQKYFGAGFQQEITESDKPPVFKQTADWLQRYFAAERPLISELPLAPTGGQFRQKVWNALCQIPYGQTVTYGELSKKLGFEKMSAQAVGGAVAHNPISIVIPCHRVIGADGSLTGYAGGLDKKIWLLRHEGAAVPGLLPRGKP